MSTDPALEWSGETRFLVCDVDSLEVLRWLHERGLRNAIALARPEKLESLRNRDPELAPRVHALRSAHAALANNAEVLWLEGESSGLLWTRRSLKQFRQIVVAPSPALEVALIARRMTGLLAPRGSLAIAGARWRVFGARGERKLTPRYYLSPEMGLERFFAELERRRIRWMVLRWWDELPERPSGDVDMLIHDDDAPAFLEVLGGRVGTLALDVYAAHGSRGMAFGGACYYPSELAAAMLARSHLNERGVRIPAREDAFFSLAFHALYHKGLKSGLATSESGLVPERAPKHDFAAILPQRARELGLSVEPTLESLDELLAAKGWRPPRDTLRKWSHKNPWIRARWFRGADRREPAGWCVFVVRRSAIELGLVDSIAADIERHGFRVLAREPLDEAAAERFRKHARGGNWGRDEYVFHGGPPAVFLIAFDPSPTRLRRRFARRYPDMDNGRIVAKRAIRDEINAPLPEDKRSNFLHTSDNSAEAWEYVRLAFPERADELRRELEGRVRV